MVTSGIATRKGVDLDFEDESESTVHVIVHDLKPPFLDGRTVFTKLLDPINPIRDPTSDMAIFAKKGSALVKEKREQAERAKAAMKLAALGGTALGNIMGVKDEEAAAEGTPCPFPLLDPAILDIHVASCILCARAPRRPCSCSCLMRVCACSRGRGQGEERGEGGLQGRLQVREPPEDLRRRERLCAEPHPARAAGIPTRVCVPRGPAAHDPGQPG